MEQTRNVGAAGGFQRKIATKQGIDGGAVAKRMLGFIKDPGIGAPGGSR